MDFEKQKYFLFLKFREIIKRNKFIFEDSELTQ
jgi:hypothetical protein